LPGEGLFGGELRLGGGERGLGVAEVDARAGQVGLEPGDVGVQVGAAGDAAHVRLLMMARTRLMRRAAAWDRCDGGRR
jgi:hypothetical protein